MTPKARKRPIRQEERSLKEFPPPARIIYAGQPVVTLGMVDRFHSQPEGTAGRNFRSNRKYLAQGVHFFELKGQPDEIRRLGLARLDGSVPAKVILLTERGYLMLSRCFRGTKGWQIQDMLVETYFRAKGAAPVAAGPALTALDVKSMVEAVVAESTPQLIETISQNVLKIVSGVGGQVDVSIRRDAIQGRANIYSFIERELRKTETRLATLMTNGAPLDGANRSSRATAAKTSAAKTSSAKKSTSSATVESSNPACQRAASKAWQRLVEAWWMTFAGMRRRAGEIAALAQADLFDADSERGRALQFASAAARCEGARFLVQDGAIWVRLRRGQGTKGSPRLYWLEPEL
jgi:hypothetical protein